MPFKNESTPILPGLSPVGGKVIVVRFDGGCMSSDGGLLALREVEQRLAIADRLVLSALAPAIGSSDASPSAGNHTFCIGPYRR